MKAMTEDEYNERLNKIDAEYQAAQRQVYIDYALSHVIFKKGDIIEDSGTIILIDKITVRKTFGLPEPVYSGAELKKDLTPKKNGNRSSSYGTRGKLIKAGN